MMTKRNASEYIIGNIQRYPVPTRDTVITGLSSGLARWACRSSVAHSSRVGRLSWLSPRRSVSCIRVALHAVSTRRLVASMIQHATFLCVTPTHVMLTFARSAHS